MIRLAAYGEQEFLIGIPGSNGEGVLVAQIERLRAHPSESSSFDSGNRSLAARDFHRSQGLSQATLMPYPEMPIFSSTKPELGSATGLRINVIEATLMAGLAVPQNVGKKSWRRFCVALYWWSPRAPPCANWF